MTCHAGENGVDVVFVDSVGILYVFREGIRFDIDVRYIVEGGQLAGLDE